MGKIAVGIIEDESIVMESLVVLFSKQHDISVHSASGSVEEFLKNDAIADIDVLLLDINLPGMIGLEGMRSLSLAMPGTNIIILTTFEDEDIIFKALCSGASGYMSKRTPPSKIVEAGRIVHSGGSFMSPLIARKVIGYFSPAARSVEDGQLTPAKNRLSRHW